jgi:hypothetical protein
MTKIQEGNLEFEFGDLWTVLKYDADGHYYKTTICKQVDLTKAVDFLCLRNDSPLLMIEAKDFSVGAPDKEKFEKVPLVVATKVRDTLAGMIGGSFRAGPPEKSFFKRVYRQLSSPPQVVYLFEDLATPARRPRQRSANKRDVLQKQLKSKLRWLTDSVIVLGLSDYRTLMPDLTIRRK